MSKKVVLYSRVSYMAPSRYSLVRNLDQDPMRNLGYPRGGVDIHGLFGCQPLETDWIKEAYVVFLSSLITTCNKPFLSLNMRITIAFYCQLGQFLDHLDAAYTTSLNSSKSLCNPSINSHFVLVFISV